MTTLKAQPAPLDLALYAGDAVRIAFAFTEGEGPWPTSGEWLAEIRSSLDPTLKLDSFTIENDEANGVVHASLTGDQVRSLWPKAIYDLQQTAPDGAERTWYKGTITIEGDVSRG